MKRFVRQSAVIARRDFLATVGTPAFLLFLFAPLFMLVFATVGGSGARMIAQSGADSLRIVAIAEGAQGTRIDAADARLRPLFGPGLAPPALQRRAPEGDSAAQARRLFADPAIDVAAVLYGPPATPVILHTAKGESGARYLAALAEIALREARAGIPPGGRLTSPRFESFERNGATISGRQATGFAALFLLFLLTLLLAGQTVSVLAEEKGNKVIEILAAAVPLETVFVGKLFGLFGVALLFIGFWGGLAIAAVLLMPSNGAALAALDPAIGFGPFVALAVVYFAMGYLLLGAMFLGIGAQAGTMREIQMLSLPITFFQMAMFGLASAAAASPGTGLALAAELFPFSSPFAMAARGATDAGLWPHAAAFAWQILWVSITIAIGARAFRSGVLKSGPSIIGRMGRLFGKRPTQY